MTLTVARTLFAASLGLCLAASPSAAAPAQTPSPDPPTLAAAPAAKEALFSGAYKDSSARDVILDIAKAAGMSAVIPADLEGNVTARLMDVPVMRALSLVVGLTNADYRVMDDTIYIVKRSIIVRPAAAGSARTATESAEAEVERIASQIDAEDAAAYGGFGPRPASAPARSYRPARSAEPVRVEVSINIQNTAPSTPTMPYQVYQPFPAYQSYTPVSYGWPIYGGPVFGFIDPINPFDWSIYSTNRYPRGRTIPGWHTR